MLRYAVRLGFLAALAATSALAEPVSDDGRQSTMAQSLDASIRDAQAKRSQGDYAGAVHVLSQLMLAAPDDARIVGEYGKVLILQGRARAAVDFLTRAVQLQQNDWTLFSALGVAYDQLGDYANARAAYDRALALKPGEPAIFNNYAMSRMLAGDLPLAKRFIAEAAAASGDRRIAENVKLIDTLAPVQAATALTARPATQAPAVSAPASVAASAPKPATHAPVALNPAANAAASSAAPATQASAPVPAAVAQGRPKPLGRPGETIMMQSVPVDPHAGPVRTAKPAATRNTRTQAHAAPVKPAAKPAATANAAAQPAKPAAKPAKPIVEGIPALRLANDKP